MKAGKKNNRGTTEKITKFPVDVSGMEDIDDEKLDALLEEELKREADELEARLNSDPKLIGVGASDDLFAKIVDSLKAQGVWEEDNAGAKEKEESVRVRKEAAEKEEREVKERERAGKETVAKENEEEERVKKEVAEEEESQEEKESVRVRKEAAEKEERQVKERERVGKETVEKENEKEERVKKEVVEEEESQEEKESVRVRKEAAEEDRNGQESERTAGKKGKDSSQEIYLQLSEEDRRAMEYGYQMQQKDAEKKVRKKKRRKLAKRAGITAAALVAVFGVSMTSDANRKYVLEKWNAVVGNRGIRTAVNYVEENGTYTESTEEKKAQQEIRERLKIEPVRLGYLPSGWEFLSCEIDQEAGYATLFYSDGTEWFNIYTKRNENRNVSYYQLDGKNGEIEKIKNSQNISIELQKVREEEGEVYAAVFSTEENSYYCDAQITYEEMKKIVKNMIIL